MSDDRTRDGRTRIFRLRALPVDAPSDAPELEDEVGYLGADSIVYRLHWGEGKTVGRVDDEGRIFRKTTYGEREVGQALLDGTVQSVGLFAGGEAGWIADGVVTYGGMILGEAEIGRVEGPRPLEAGAALLLIFFLDEREAEHAARD